MTSKTNVSVDRYGIYMDKRQLLMEILTDIDKTFPRRMFTFDELVQEYDWAVEEGKRKLQKDRYWRKIPEVKVPVIINAGLGHQDTLIITYANTSKGWVVKYVEQH